jgi:hypothetical protein
MRPVWEVSSRAQSTPAFAGSSASCPGRAADASAALTRLPGRTFHSPDPTPNQWRGRRHRGRWRDRDTSGPIAGRADEAFAIPFGDDSAFALPCSSPRYQTVIYSKDDKSLTLDNLRRPGTSSPGDPIRRPHGSQLTSRPPRSFRVPKGHSLCSALPYSVLLFRALGAFLTWCLMIAVLPKRDGDYDRGCLGGWSCRRRRGQVATYRSVELENTPRLGKEKQRGGRWTLSWPRDWIESRGCWLS